MLDANDALAALLEGWRLDSNAAPYIAELYQITTSTGLILRWTSADQDIRWGGHAWVRGPGISRSQISRSIGTASSELDVTLSYDDTVLMDDGVRLSAFIQSGGLFYSTLALFRGYAESPAQAIVGVLPKFKGRTTKLTDTGETQATLHISDVRSLLNVQVPSNLWQPSCNHTVFDSGCKLLRENFQVVGAVVAGSTRLVVKTNLSSPADYLDQGKVVFNTGINAGQSFTIKDHLADGTLKLIRRMPAVPHAGDEIVAYPGCDLTTATCRDKFNNLQHRKGFEYVPLPETAAP